MFTEFTYRIYIIGHKGHFFLRSLLHLLAIRKTAGGLSLRLWQCEVRITVCIAKAEVWMENSQQKPREERKAQVLAVIEGKEELTVGKAELQAKICCGWQSVL